MNQALTFGGVDGDAAGAAYARILGHSFGRTGEEASQWLARVAPQNVRLLSAPDGAVAGLMLIPMGQFFGGRRVPMVGVAAVGVSPEARGRGAATELMGRALGELHGKGVALSALYAATQALYRRVGYEQAGHRFETRVALNRIDSRERTMPVREIRAGDREAIVRAYNTFAPGQDGSLDRNAAIWDRIERPPPGRKEPARAFLVEGGDGRVEGYVYLSQPPAERGRHEVHAHDLVALTERAGRRLWALLASYGTLGTDLVWFTGPTHPMLMMLGEQAYRMTLRDHWMVRVVDVGAALRARGYPAGVDRSVSLWVRDEVIGANTGRYVLAVKGRRGSVKREKGDGPDKGDLALDVGALAAVYSGFATPMAMRTTGRVEGPDKALRLAASLFASPGGGPWMTDFF